MRLSGFLFTTVAAGMLLAACGDEDSAEPAANPPASASASNNSPSPSGSDADGPPTSTCQGTPGDGIGAELTTAEVKQLGFNLQITFETAAPVETRDVVLYTVDAWDLDGEVGYQLGVEIDRRGQATEYLLSHPDEVRTDVDKEVEATGTTVIATYPMELLGNIGTPFKWSATLKIGADPADSCPAVGDDPLDPERVVFPE